MRSEGEITLDCKEIENSKGEEGSVKYTGSVKSD